MNLFLRLLEAFKFSLKVQPLERRLAEKRLSSSLVRSVAYTSGHIGNIAIRESCRETNQRKRRKAFRQRIALGATS